MSSYWYTDELGRKRHVNNSYLESDYKRKEKKYEHSINLFHHTNDISKSLLYTTKCPVCSDKVYFCQCSNGGRVFFDTLAPLWQKHPSTIGDKIISSNLKSYSFIIPKHTIHTTIAGIEKKETTFYVPDFLEPIVLNTTNKTLYANLMRYSIILIQRKNNLFYLSVIITSRNFNNQFFCKELEFLNIEEIKTFIQIELGKNDFDDEFIPYNLSKKLEKKVKIEKSLEKKIFQKHELEKKEKIKQTKKDGLKIINKINKKANIKDLAEKGWTIK